MQINHKKSTKFTVIKLTNFRHHHTELRDQSVLITMQYGTMVHFNVSDFNIIVKKDEAALKTEQVLKCLALRLVSQMIGT